MELFGLPLWSILCVATTFMQSFCLLAQTSSSNKRAVRSKLLNFGDKLLNVEIENMQNFIENMQQPVQLFISLQTISCPLVFLQL